MSFVQIDVNGYFKAIGDILTADADITALVGTEIYVEGIVISASTKPLITMGMDLGGTWDNLPTKSGQFNISGWINAETGDSDYILRQIGDRVEFLLDGDDGKDLINSKGEPGVNVRRIEHLSSIMIKPDMKNVKRYSITFDLTIGKTVYK